MGNPRPDFPESLLSRIRWRRRQGNQWPGGGQSRSVGDGGDFEGHRRRQSGEDLQHLDLHVWQRLRQRWIREYRQEADEPLHVVIDAAPSMSFGHRSIALQHLRTLLKGVAHQSRVPHREWIIEASEVKPLTASVSPHWRERVPLDETLLQLPQSMTHGRVIVISDRLIFDELSQFSAPPPAHQLQWWSLWLEEESAPTWNGPLNLLAPGGQSWQSHFDPSVLEQYQRLFQQQTLILQDWLKRHGGLHVSVPAVTSAAKILQDLTATRGPLEVVSG